MSRTLWLTGLAAVAGLTLPPVATRAAQPAPNAERRLVVQFDRDGNKRLDAAERQAARDYLRTQPAGRGGGPGRGRGAAPAAGIVPGERLAPADVATYAGRDIYDPDLLRTFFLEFPNADWEQELSAFINTDVEVPATLIVDGQRFNDVGIHFRGMSSLMSVPEGRKRSLNLSLDFVHDTQALGGYRTFNLLNSHTDPTFLRTMLYLQAARDYLPAPEASFVRVVINGESWGVYVSAQQFNKDFVRDFFGTTDGERWKVPGSPNGRGGLEYLGEDPAPYRRVYEIKSKDTPAAWRALIDLTRVLNGTPTEDLEAALTPRLDVDGVLKFLALEIVLANADGYWTRASDYSLYRDPAGRFHVIPHDANETFGTAGGPGRGGGRRGFGPPDGGGPGRPPGPPPGVTLDPLIGMDDETKPLRARLLAVPALRARYLGYVHDIAETWLDWNRLQPLVRQHQALISEDVRKDTRKLDTNEAFVSGVERLRTFAADRRAFLMAHGH